MSLTRQIVKSHENALNLAQQRADLALQSAADREGYGDDVPMSEFLWIVGELSAALTSTKLIALLQLEEIQKLPHLNTDGSENT